MDEVDQLVAAWRRERPDLDTEPMQVCSRISRLAQLLDAARARAYTAQVLQVWEFDVLAVLRRAGEPYRLTPGQLINQTHVTSGTMTNRVVRLAEGRPQQRNDLRVVNRFSTPHHQIAGTDSSHIASRERRW